jgi:hypothetical protein
VAVNAGHLPGLIRRRNGEFDRLTEGGIALGMFDHSHYTAQAARLEPGDLLVLYSDGITEAESPSGAPFDEAGLMALIRAHADNPNLPEIGKAVIKAVERHAQDVRFSDDLTILLARRTVERPAETVDSDVVVPPIPSPRHSGGSRNPATSWTPAFAGVTDHHPGAPIPNPQPTSFRRKPESSHPLAPGIRRGDDSIRSEPPARRSV